jgi:hypothetical protein
MGILRDETSGQDYPLAARSVIGRSRTCAVRLKDRRVSGEHALLAWNGERWSLRDLGSSNGTYVDGRSLTPGERAELDRNVPFSFGHNEGGWRLVEDGPPVPRARALPDGAYLAAQGGVLLLPDDAPEICVFQGADGSWCLEHLDGARPVAMVDDRDVVEASGRSWRLSLPIGLAPTLTLEESVDLGLRFRVSQDEEYVELDIAQGGQVVPMGALAHNYLLLTLARERLSERGLPEPERGWMDLDLLANGLRTTPATLNVQIHRARQRLAAAGLDYADRLIERRMRTRKLRVGTDDVTIERC